MKKVILFFMIVLVLGAVCVIPAFATENEDIQPYYNRFVGIETGLNLSAGKASYEGSAYTTYTTDQIYVTVYLQQNVNGVWNTIDSRSANAPLSVSAYGSCKITSGYNYRVRVDAKVYNSLGYLLESVTEYSSQKYY